MPVVAVAHPNIALVKYWGKRDAELNLPAVGSLSATLGDLHTRTEVELAPELVADELLLDNTPASEDERVRTSRWLDRIRQRVGSAVYARVRSVNDFPTAAGLASSASGFAALTVAATHAYGLVLTPTQQSELARMGSGSAARSIFGGFVQMHVGRRLDGTDAIAEELAPASHWPLTVLVAVTSVARKAHGSTDGMTRSEKTSPYFPAWVSSQADDLAEGRAAVLTRDFERLAHVAEASCLKMHALAMSARPGIVYWNAATVELMAFVKERRSTGAPLFFSIDAGPQVKVFTLPEYAAALAAELEQISGVVKVLHSGLGEGARLVGAPS